MREAGAALCAKHSACHCSPTIERDRFEDELRAVQIRLEAAQQAAERAAKARLDQAKVVADLCQAAALEQAKPAEGGEAEAEVTRSRGRSRNPSKQIEPPPSPSAPPPVFMAVRS